MFLHFFTSMACEIVYSLQTSCRNNLFYSWVLLYSHLCFSGVKGGCKIIFNQSKSILPKFEEWAKMQSSSESCPWEPVSPPACNPFQAWAAFPCVLLAVLSVWLLTNTGTGWLPFQPATCGSSNARRSGAASRRICAYAPLCGVFLLKQYSSCASCSTTRLCTAGNWIFINFLFMM